MRHLLKGISWIFTSLLLVLAVLPFVLMLITAVQETTRLSYSIDFSKLTLQNFYNLFEVQNFGGALLTSTIVVVLACVMNIVVCSLAAYGFAFKRFPGSEGIFWIYIVSMMVPGQVTIIPMFVMFKEMGIIGSYLSLALPVVNAFGVFLIRQFMYSIPPSLVEAARIDGATDFQIFVRIILPLIRSVLVALTVFTFLTTWNDFLWPLVSLQSDTTQTVTLAVSQLKGSFSTQYGMVMAGTTIAFMVPFLVYAFMQRQFVEGVTSSGVKG
ncbi:ABC transporter, permease protein [Gleimia coleocanis DSM 15436]|uniref:ABC transporter, permease protein n=1 Tax=Gleimia coleocanis DSM 15436 TaxID=525245 RepID=C0W1A1_9ACTO|nr:carbohydrate ABC transporter permease [Gleimia coleocanis]EEH63590.1 ABC transporter, permease protein [Gleimia coleocanis DSM 15436]